MSDIATTAKSARESLARGLSALQSDPNIPAHLVELATPIAQAMSALHQIERSNGTQLSPHAETALSNVRTALSQLQAQPNVHPAVSQAMESVAGSLGLVHALSKLVGQAPQPAAQPQPAAAYGAPPPQQQYAPPPQQQQYAPPPQPQQYAPPPQPQQYAPAQPPQPAFPPPAHQPVQPMPAAAPDPFAPQRSPMAATAVAPNQAAVGMPMSANPPAPAPVGNAPVVAAELGAHSPSNFYKGLSGNDIIDHGGLFVSTYMIPKIGSPVRLRVSLPGGYEFEANAVVQWAREQGGDAPPGFGARFTQITPEARQLVYRYVRNREPLFHDDL
ncbi:MAG TPA: PilZ domain-containing protein [Polyangiaceae bacterium]|nr:PilZ domain-containing protein [Polyangiaceae bacterium]